MSALMIGVAGETLSAPERAWIANPAVAGVILFKRNFSDRAQLRALCDAIRECSPQAIIAVDQEGGRVQRFIDEHTLLPPLASIGALYHRAPFRAYRAARLHAQIMAAEILSDGLDLSFAPVADLGRGNLAIGDRAFDPDPLICAELSAIYARTLQDCGMPATLKHFPGHGSVLADTHHDRAIDSRAVAQILDEDLLPFAVGVLAGARAVMLAHVEYPQADAAPAGYSRYWVREVLREGLGFRGVVISDDIGMAAGAQISAIEERLRIHADAGCDLILVCDPILVSAATESATRLGFRTTAILSKRLRGRIPADLRKARESSTWGRVAARLTALFEPAGFTI